MTDKHTAESRQMIEVGRSFGRIAIWIAVVLTIVLPFLWDRVTPGSATAILVSAGLAFFFSAGLAVWCLPTSGCDCGKTQKNTSSGSAPGAGANDNPEASTPTGQ